MTDIREKIHNVTAKNISKAQACQAKNYNLRHKGETLKVGDKIMKKNKKAEQRKGDKLGPRWLGPYLITAVHDNRNYMVANPKMGKVLATRCPQSECKLYIDLMLGTTEKHYQGKPSFYNARVALQYTSISCITYPAKQLIEHTLISCQINKQVYCFLYLQDALAAAKKLEPQHPEPLASSDSGDQGKQSFIMLKLHCNTLQFLV